MRMTYDPTADAMYLYLSERAAGGPEVARTEEAAPGLVLDFDGDDRDRDRDALGLEAATRQTDADGVRDSNLTASDSAAAE